MSHHGKQGGVLLAAMGLTWVLGCPTSSKPPPQRSSLSGQAAGRSFEGDTSAAFRLEIGAARTVIIRVANRANTCEAINDPSDTLDPSLLITLTPDQKGTYPILDPVSTGQAPPDRYATATLAMVTDPPDGGWPADGGPLPVMIRAYGGEVNVTAIDPDDAEGRLNADITVLVADGGFNGKIGAAPCERVR